MSHTAIATTSKGVVDTITVQTGSPAKGEVLIRVAYSSLIAFDTYMADLGYATPSYPAILGFNASGTIVKVGEGVDGLKVGDRVTAFTYQSKGMQEYTIQPYTVCAKIPDSLGLAEAATIPDNFITAFGTLFNPLYFALPIPSSFPSKDVPKDADTAILVYGAGSTTGQYAVQLLSLAGYRKIIATASDQHHEYLHSLGATATFDYKDPLMKDKIADYLGGDGKVHLAIDCVTSTGTLKIIAGLVRDTSQVALLLPIKEGSNVRALDDSSTMHMTMPESNPLPNGTKHHGVRTFLYQENEYQRINLMPKILPQLLQDGYIKPNRVRLYEQGSLQDRVAAGLQVLRTNQVSGEKVVIRVEA